MVVVKLGGASRGSAGLGGVWSLLQTAALGSSLPSAALKVVLVGLDAVRRGMVRSGKAGFVTKYDKGAARPLLRPRHGILLSWAAMPPLPLPHEQNRLHPKIPRQRWLLDRLRSLRQA